MNREERERIGYVFNKRLARKKKMDDNVRIVRIWRSSCIASVLIALVIGVGSYACNRSDNEKAKIENVRAKTTTEGQIDAIQKIVCVYK